MKDEIVVQIKSDVKLVKYPYSDTVDLEYNQADPYYSDSTDIAEIDQLKATEIIAFLVKSFKITKEELEVIVS